jgi:mannose-1-phosphate guanylyltransferase
MNDPMQRSIYAVIMAGGVGSRFWPKSRERSPKQFMEIIGSGTMIQNTVTRLAPLVPKENIVVVTNEVHLELIRQQLPDLPEENILTEPVGRNTAPCIGLAAHWIQKRKPSSTMIVLPSDHLIRNTEEFLSVLGRGIRVANENRALVTIGIHPTHPETGYGYIQYDDAPESNPDAAEGVYRVRTFAEKPNLETAVQFIKSGDFVWNSGMFIWKSDVILEEIAAHLPELSEQLSHVAATMETPEYSKALELAFGVIRSISIDYGVMEKAAQVFVVRGDFGWSDVGSWDEVVRLTPGDDEGNSFRGNVIRRDSRGNYIDAGDKTIAAIGVDDLIVVSAGDAILICRKGRAQDVKEVVDFLRRKQMNELL